MSYEEIKEQITKAKKNEAFLERLCDRHEQEISLYQKLS